MATCTLYLPDSQQYSHLNHNADRSDPAIESQGTESGKLGKLYALALLSLVLLWNIRTAQASTFTINPIGNLFNTTISDVGVELVKASQLPDGTYPRDVISISYKDKSTGAPVTITKTISPLTGGLRVLIEAVPGSITVTNLSEPAVPALVASLDSFDPPSNVVVSAFTVAPGSALTFAGNTFTLSGGFTAIDTTVSYDPTSPLYALEGGSVTSANILGTGPAGTVELELTSPAVYSLDLSSIWAQALANDDVPALGLSTLTNISLQGILFFNSNPIPFTGTFSGNTTFFDDGSTTESGTLQLTTAAGVATGSLSASAMPQLVTPEPGSLSLLILGLPALVLTLKKAAITHPEPHP